MIATKPIRDKQTVNTVDNE